MCLVALCVNGDRAKSAEVAQSGKPKSHQAQLGEHTPTETMSTPPGTVIIRATDQHFLGTGGVPGYSGTDDWNTPIVNCPSGSFVTGIQGFSVDGKAGLVNLRYICASTSGGEKVNRATDAGFAGTGKVSGYAGTDDPADQWVSCPTGSFVSAIQGFSFNGRYVVVNLRYACRSGANNSIELKATAAAFAGTGTVEHFAGTDDLADPSVSCPLGTYVTAIQGFLQSTALSEYGIINMRYVCR